jgi:hypothetical protein
MNAFDLTRTPLGGVEILDWRESGEDRGWDTLRVSVAGRMTPAALRAIWPEGRYLDLGVGMVVERAEAGQGPNGWAEGDVYLRGLWNTKRWGREVGDIERKGTAGAQIVEGGSSVTYNRLSWIDVVPGFEVIALDGVRPNQAALGKAATSPYPGLTFPTVGSIPYSFWGTYEPTYQRPYGWVLTRLDSEEIGRTRQLYRKVFGYSWLWPVVP